VTALLELDAVEAGYDGAKVLHGLSFSIGAGEAIAIVGRNGAGKTTAVNAFLGIARLYAGRVLFRGSPCPAPRHYTAARAGIAVVPQGRGILPNLSVRENLLLGGATDRAGRWTEERVFELFPALRQRAHHRGTALSGGEQQMLAIGRALLSNPDLLVLDEPSEGLAPVVVDRVAEVLRRLHGEGTAILLIEQHLALIESVARACHVLSKGRIVESGPLDESTSRALRKHIAI
jgi:ABC-type branched-subunit amino acid transport system ATPase component